MKFFPLAIRQLHHRAVTDPTHAGRVDQIGDSVELSRDQQLRPTRERASERLDRFHQRDGSHHCTACSAGWNSLQDGQLARMSVPSPCVQYFSINPHLKYV